MELEGPLHFPTEHTRQANFWNVWKRNRDSLWISENRIFPGTPMWRDPYVHLSQSKYSKHWAFPRAEILMSLSHQSLCTVRTSNWIPSRAYLFHASVQWVEIRAPNPLRHSEGNSFTPAVYNSELRRGDWWIQYLHEWREKGMSLVDIYARKSKKFTRHGMTIVVFRKS